MGEIKSTIDLVMEKTRNLKLSEEEKERNALIEARKRLEGLLSRLEAGTIKKSEFIASIKSLGKMGDKQVALCISERIDPFQKKSPFVEVFAELTGTKVQSIEDILKEYTRKKDGLFKERTSFLLSALKTKTGLFGSAVLPNLESDPKIREEKEAILSDCRSKLCEIVHKSFA